MNDVFSKVMKKFLDEGNIIDGSIPQIIGCSSINSLKNRGGNKCLFLSGSILKNTIINFYETEGDLKIAENCYIDSYFGIGKGCSVNIKSGTVFNGHAAIKLGESTNLTIGENCLIAPGLYMSTTDWHTIIDIETQERINKAKDISIGNHVWIAQDVKILKGAVIGHDSVIGAGSVVVGHIPSNVVAAGVPARIVKTGITWKRELI